MGGKGNCAFLPSNWTQKAWEYGQETVEGQERASCQQCQKLTDSSQKKRAGIKKQKGIEMNHIENSQVSSENFEDFIQTQKKADDPKALRNPDLSGATALK